MNTMIIPSGTRLIALSLITVIPSGTRLIALSCEGNTIDLCIIGGGDVYRTTIIDHAGIVWRRFEKAFEKTFALRHGYRLDWICGESAITIILSNPHMDMSYQYVAKKIEKS